MAPSGTYLAAKAPADGPVRLSTHSAMFVAHDVTPPFEAWLEDALADPDAIFAAADKAERSFDLVYPKLLDPLETPPRLEEFWNLAEAKGYQVFLASVEGHVEPEKSNTTIIMVVPPRS